jgi:sugar phosphate isomerase/epimerase
VTGVITQVLEEKHNLVPKVTLFGYPGKNEGPGAAIREGTREIEKAFAVAEKFNLPLLVEELGYRASSEGPTPDDERAEVFRALLGAAHALGLGVFPWMIGETGREDYDGLLIRPTDKATFASLRCE